MIKLFGDIKKFIATKKVVLLALTIAGLVFLFFILNPKKSSPATTKPPVVEAGGLEVLSVEPTGQVKSLNTLFPVAVKFNQDLGKDITGIKVSIEPKVQFTTYTLTSMPDTLWIQPITVQNSQSYGWLDGVEYTIVIAKGSKLPGGAFLTQSYTFSLSNSTQGVSMEAEPAI